MYYLAVACMVAWTIHFILVFIPGNYISSPNRALALAKNPFICRWHNYADSRDSTTPVKDSIKTFLSITKWILQSSGIDKSNIVHNNLFTTIILNNWNLSTSHLIKQQILTWLLLHVYLYLNIEVPSPIILIISIVIPHLRME